LQLTVSRRIAVVCTSFFSLIGPLLPVTAAAFPSLGMQQTIVIENAGNGAFPLVKRHIAAPILEFLMLRVIAFLVLLFTAPDSRFTLGT
jgi:hypothetical protein